MVEVGDTCTWCGGKGWFEARKEGWCEVPRKQCLVCKGTGKITAQSIETLKLLSEVMKPR